MGACTLPATVDPSKRASVVSFGPLIPEGVDEDFFAEAETPKPKQQIERIKSVFNFDPLEIESHSVSDPSKQPWGHFPERFADSSFFPSHQN